MIEIRANGEVHFPRLFSPLLENRLLNEIDPEPTTAAEAILKTLKGRKPKNPRGCGPSLSQVLGR